MITSNLLNESNRALSSRSLTLEIRPAFENLYRFDDAGQF
jgi:hypothetical protein